LYSKLEPGKLAEFERRVADFVDKKEKEMTEMKEQHSKIMGRINKGKIYLDAEERLREAGTDSQKMEEIVRELELDMGITLQERKEVVCVQKGGLQDEDEKQMNGSAAGSSGAAEDQFNDHTAAGLLDEFTSTADFTNSEHVDKADPVQSEAVADAVAPDAALDLVDGMDLDIEGIEFPSGSPAAETDAKVAEDEWVHVPSKQPSPAAPAAAATEETEKSVLEQTSENNGSNNGQTVDTDDVLQPESMFDGADFGSFESLEGGGTFDANDDLLNFDGEFGGNASAEGAA
jgi:hypothetical protein